MEVYIEKEGESALYASDRIVSLAMDLSEKLLEKGAQIQRVETTVIRVCLAYGAVQVEPFAIPSLIQASVKMPDGYHTTQIRRVYQNAVDLSGLLELAKLVDKICKEKPSLEEAEREFHAIADRPIGFDWMRIVGMPIGAGGFAVTFGGGILDAFCAAIIGFAVAWLNILFRKKILNSTAIVVLDAFLSGMMSVLLCAVGFGKNLDAINAGTIMLFITGVLFSAALQDLICGDLVASLFKFMQSVLSAVAIVAGYSLSLWVGTRLPVAPSPDGVTPLWADVIATCLVGTLGFCFVYRVPLKEMGFSVVGGLVSYGLWILCKNVFRFENYFLIAFLSSLGLSVYSEIVARIRKNLVSVYMTPSIFPLAPGYHLYYAIFHLMNKNTEQFWAFASNTVLISAGIAVGVVLISLVLRIIKIPKMQRHLHKTH
ncbi:MAG: threonine/serine exporter family protein [Clostridia bacterium]|nr:threonine/serine exporter family protein [Clostridia bacterium]